MSGARDRWPSCWRSRHETSRGGLPDPTSDSREPTAPPRLAGGPPIGASSCGSPPSRDSPGCAHEGSDAAPAHVQWRYDGLRRRARPLPSARGAPGRRRHQLRLLLRARHRASNCCCSTRTTRPSRSRPSRSTRSDNRSFAIWHVYVPGLRAPVFYALRVFGPEGDEARRQGHRFDPQKVLIDPYARGLDRTLWDRGSACAPGDNVATSPRSAVVDLADYDWEGDQPLNRPMEDLVIYEAHVGGFTRSPSAQVRAAGHVRRPHREDPVPDRRSASPPWNCCRSSTSTTARSATSTTAG